MTPVETGPIEGYLLETGQDLDEFKAKLRAGDPAAAAIYAADRIVLAMDAALEEIRSQDQDG